MLNLQTSSETVLRLNQRLANVVERKILLISTSSVYLPTFVSGKNGRKAGAYGRSAISMAAAIVRPGGVPIQFLYSSLSDAGVHSRGQATRPCDSFPENEPVAALKPRRS
jgi:hypothetical protein